MQTTIGLSRFLNSLPLRCNVKITIKRTFSWVVIWAQRSKKKEIGKYFWECGANSKENYRATNNEPNYQEESPTL